MKTLLHKTKKLLPLTALLWAAALVGNAVPATPEPIRIVDEDGTERWVKVVGDENGFTAYSCNDNLPVGWTLSSEKLSRSIFGRKTPALQMSADGDTMEFRYDDAVIESLRFFHRSLSSVNSVVVDAFGEDNALLRSFEIPAEVAGKN